MDTTALPMEEIRVGENVLPIEDFTEAIGSLVATHYLRIHRRHIFEMEEEDE